MSAQIHQLRTPEERVKAALELVKPRPQVQIKTLEEALAWGDSWQRAYNELLQQARSEADKLQWQILDLRTDLNIERAERTLEKLQASEPPKQIIKTDCPF